MNKEDAKFIIRTLLSCGLVTAIYYRVDWTVALLAWLLLIRVEIEDHFKK